MRLLCVIAFIFACFPVYANGNHDKNKHDHKDPVKESPSGGSKSNKGLYAVIGVLGVTAVWQFGKNSKKEPQIGLQVKERE